MCTALHCTVVCSVFVTALAGLYIVADKDLMFSTHSKFAHLTPPTSMSKAGTDAGPTGDQGTEEVRCLCVCQSECAHIYGVQAGAVCGSCLSALLSLFINYDP